MTANFTLTDVAPLAREIEAARDPAAAQHALDTYRYVAQAAPRLWPDTPDQERLRFYMYATRHARDACEGLELAWTIIGLADFWMSTIAEMIDASDSSGMPPVIEETDLESVLSPVMERARELSSSEFLVPIGVELGTRRSLVPSSGSSSNSELGTRKARKGMAKKRAAILRLHGEGWGQREIAAKLHSSLSTVGKVIREDREVTENASESD